MAALMREHAAYLSVVESVDSGKTLAEANLRSKIGVHVMGLKDVMKGKFEMFPDGKTKLLEDQVLLVVGRETEIAALRELP